jgi:hypothetical protein
MKGTIVEENIKGSIAVDSFFVTDVDTSNESLALIKEKLTEMGFGEGVDTPFRYTEVAHLFGNTKDRILFMASLSLLVTESGDRVFTLSRDHSTVITPKGGINVEQIAGFADFATPIDINHKDNAEAEAGEPKAEAGAEAEAGEPKAEAGAEAEAEAEAGEPKAEAEAGAGAGAEAGAEAGEPKAEAGAEAGEPKAEAGAEAGEPKVEAEAEAEAGEPKAEAGAEASNNKNKGKK